MDIGSIGDLKCSVKHILSMAANQPRVLHKLHTNACGIVTILQNFSNAMHQDIAENVFGFSQVYPGFQVIGNLGTGNLETGFFGGFCS